MTTKEAAILKIDHSRGLCGMPDVPNNTSLEQVLANPAHCQCCGSEMKVIDCNSIGMQQLGMYWLICSNCPQNPSKLSN